MNNAGVARALGPFGTYIRTYIRSTCFWKREGIAGKWGVTRLLYAPLWPPDLAPGMVAEPGLAAWVGWAECSALAYM
jgi:hypothetical protein